MKSSGTFLKTTLVACLAAGVAGNTPVVAATPTGTESGEHHKCIDALESPCIDRQHKAEQKPVAHQSVDTPDNIKRLDRGDVLTSVEERALKRWVRAKILIKATPKIVWDTVHEERHHNPEIEYSKVLEQGHNQAIIEQKFCVVPIIGTAVCVMKNTETPLERIDYQMLHSDRFKAMDGSWIFTPSADGTSTYLELTTHNDIGLPFPRLVQEGVTAKKLQRRLSNVKKMAETAQNRVARLVPTP